MASNLGHFGLNAIVVGACALVALVVHLSVPYVVEWEDGDAETHKRSEVSDEADNLGDAWVSSSGPGITLAGIIMALAAGVGLVALGFVPMAVEPARWTGWMVAAIAAVGSALAFVSSMYWVGVWFAEVMNLGQALAPDFVMVFSPLFVAILGGVGVWASLGIQRNVAPASARDQAARDHRLAKLGLAFIAIVVFVPWVFTTEGDSVTWVSAWEVLLTNGITSDGPGFFGGEEMWDGLAYSLTVLVTTGWVIFGLATLTSMRGLLEASDAAAAGRLLPMTAFLGLFMMLWATVMYILAWSIYFKPTSDAEDIQPGYFPVLLLAAAVPIVWMLVTQVRSVFATRAWESKGGGKRKPVRFE